MDVCFAYSKRDNTLHEPKTVFASVDEQPVIVWSDSCEEMSGYETNENVADNEGMTSEVEGEEIQEEEQSSPEPARAKRVKSLANSVGMSDHASSSHSQSPTHITSSTTSLPLSVIVSQMPQTEELTALTYGNLERFKGQIQLL